jgi:hypothetical protein
MSQRDGGNDHEKPEACTSHFFSMIIINRLVVSTSCVSAAMVSTAR